MKHLRLTLIYGLCLFAAYGLQAQTTSDKVLGTFGNNKIYSSEFEYVYKKNNANTDDAYSEKSIRDYLNLYTNFRLKVKEAEDLGLDTSTAFKKELEGYRKQLAQPYLTEKKVTDSLVRQAYERMKWEVNCSHILVKIAPDADPADTLKAYNKILDYRKKILGGKDFNAMAAQYSDDKYNRGNLGYFTALSMVYQFEEQAYTVPVGQVSQPFRTQFGYHILKVHDRRASQGRIKIAHIMVRATTGIAYEDSVAAKQKIDEIYKQLQDGGKWDELAANFSEDQGTKNDGGALKQYFQVGELRVPSMEEVAFALKNPNDYTKPVQSPYGWHIVKLLDRKPLDPFEQLESTIKSKVSKDTRSELNKALLLQRLKKENKFVEQPKNLEAALKQADSSLVLGQFDKKAEGAKNLLLFSINGEKYTTNDFFSYLKANARPKKGASPQAYMRNLYKEYVESSNISYEEKHLEEKKYDYRMLVREYRDGILLFQLMDDKVWSKAIEDTAGLKNYYMENKLHYRWDTRATAAVYNVSSPQVLDQLKQELAKGRYAVSEPKGDKLVFEKKKANLSAEQRKKLDMLIVQVNMSKDKSLLIELTGSCDPKEKNLSLARMDSVKAYLKLKGGFSEDRFVMVNKGKVKPTGTEEVKYVNIAFYSTSNKALENYFNNKAPLSLQVTQGTYQKGENADLDKIQEWKQGDFTQGKDNRTNYIVISKVEAPRAKSFEEARGLVISDYQSHLEKQWIKELKDKYPVQINEEVVKSLIKK